MRVLMRRRTCSALSARRLTGPAMVLASRIDSTIITAAATPNTRRMAMRSAVTIWSMSSPWVDSISEPLIARKPQRCTGTATETITSPRSLTRTADAFRAGERLRDFVVALAVFRTELAIGRQVAAVEPVADRDHRAFGEPRLAPLRRRQVEAQHVAARDLVAAVEQQHAVAVVDAGAGLRRRDQAAQHRRHARRIDRKVEAGENVFRGAEGLAGFQIDQAVGVDGDAVGVRGAGRRDRARDDLALHQQALRLCVDQAGAELRQVEHAGDKRDQAGQVERQDAARQARGCQAEEILAGAAEPARRAQPRGECQAGWSPQPGRPGEVCETPTRLRLRAAGFAGRRKWRRSAFDPGASFEDWSVKQRSVRPLVFSAGRT